MRPQRTFSADVGQTSIDNRGPDAIENDIDNINRMFDPAATHEGGESGGIGAENLGPGLSALAGGGDSTNHYHSSDRDRANHTGTQEAGTVSDFAETVRATQLTGVPPATPTAISAADSVLSAFGKLQAQVTANDSAAVHKTGNEAIGGVKTFSNSPVAPVPESAGQVANKE
jgi:hypothetical protein